MHGNIAFSLERLSPSPTRLYYVIHGERPPSLELPCTETAANAFPGPCAHDHIDVIVLLGLSCHGLVELALAREDELSSTASYTHVGGRKYTSSWYSLLSTFYDGMMAALSCGEW